MSKQNERKRVIGHIIREDLLSNVVEGSLLGSKTMRKKTNLLAIQVYERINVRGSEKNSTKQRRLDKMDVNSTEHQRRRSY